MSRSRPTIDLAHDLVYRSLGRQALDSIFSPHSVAVVGASAREGSVGRTILWNLLRNPFGGTVYPINPKRGSVLGVKAYPDLRSLPEPVDLAVIVTPAWSVPEIVGECAETGVRGVIVISAGFKEVGEEGAALERQILEQARRANMRIIGPNCLGVMNPLTGLNATFASTMARPGNVGFISQSGALCTAVLDWSLQENVGFSAFISLGSMLDVGWGDLIDYLGDDPHTSSIVIYMETIGDARAFMSAAREIALTKPIIVIKPGRTEAGARAAASHTGSLTGSDEVLEAAFRRCGVLRVERIAELFNMAEVLAKQPRPSGPNLTIVTNAGGPGVLAADALIGGGGALADLSEKTHKALNETLPPHWSHNNPIDVLGDADPKRYADALQIAANDSASHGLLVILTPQAMTDPTQTAEHLKPHAQVAGKPLLASWMGGAEVAAGESILNRAGIPTFAYPDSAARAFNYMWQYSQVLRANYEAPGAAAADDAARVDWDTAKQTLEGARQSGRTLLTEDESKRLLAAYGLPVVPTTVAATVDAAVDAAERLGYPAVVKLHSETITHKTDVGGVKLSLRNADAVREAFEEIEASVREAHGQEHFLGVTVQPMVKLDGYELILGSSTDDQFGPVLLFGAGGTLVEVFKDRALGLPPLNRTLARRLIERTKISKALQGTRGRPPVDIDALECAVVRFSQLVAEQPWIKEIDINPLLASDQRVVALDARVVLHDLETPEDQLPRLAVRPYPHDYVWQHTLKSEETVTIRPIRPEDEPLMVEFHHGLSDETVYRRYLQQMALSERIARERLIRICFIDYDREMVLVAEGKDPQSGQPRVVAAGRVSRLHGTQDARFAIVVADSYQGRGLGGELFARLIEVARGEGITALVAEISSDNKTMQHLCQRHEFDLVEDAEQARWRARLELHN